MLVEQSRIRLFLLYSLEFRKQNRKFQSSIIIRKISSVRKTSGMPEF